MIKDVQEKKISFYTAECMEFETMGEVTECATLKEAFRIYQKMEQKRSGMGVGMKCYNKVVTEVANKI